MRHTRIAALLLAALLCVPAGALGAEGDPLLSVDDLLSLEESYGAFLTELESLIVARGLLSEEERGAWRDAQMGDFFQNGGYGSILASYMPGALGLVREEETLAVLRVPLDGGLTLEVSTMRRYTPQDSSLPGLMLTLSLEDASGAPLDATFSLSATSGVFRKWDALAGTYADVGVSVGSDGETVVWSNQTPAADARDPVITVTVLDDEGFDFVQMGRALLNEPDFVNRMRAAGEENHRCGCDHVNYCIARMYSREMACHKHCGDQLTPGIRKEIEKIKAKG